MTSLVHDYSNIDNSHYIKTQQSSAMMMNTDANNEITNPKFFSSMDNQTFAGFSLHDDIQITNSIKKIDNIYNNITEDNINHNIMTNMHTHIQNNSDKELERLHNLTQNSKNNLQKAKFESKEIRNSSNIYIYYMKLVVVTLLFATIIISLMLSIVTYDLKIKKQTLYIILSVIAFIYVLLIVLYYRDTLKRRKDDWDKRIFNPPKI